MAIDTFHMMATVLSMVLGLGVTRLLLGVVTVFRTRHRSPVDWLPLAWAGCLFLIQLEYWWAINQLPITRPTYTFVDFISLVILTLMLFLASALLLPSRPEDETGGLRAYFESEGRYGLLAIAAFCTLGFLANIFFFRSPLKALWAVLDVPIISLPVAGFVLRDRRMQVLIVCLYIPLLIVDTWIALSR